MDIQAVGRQISDLRRAKGLTQAELGERLGVTYQAVSKWERAETLPDTAILPELAEVLETTVDNLLRGGQRTVAYTKKLTMEDLKRAIRCLDDMGRLMGRDNPIYLAAVEGINTRMNSEIRDAFSDRHIFEVFVAEAAIQGLMAGAYLDPTDVRNSFESVKLRDIVLAKCAEYGIK